MIDYSNPKPFEVWDDSNSTLTNANQLMCESFAERTQTIGPDYIVCASIAHLPVFYSYLI